MNTPTVAIRQYRGVSIYIRKLFRETFEYLIVHDDQIFCNQVEIRRESGQRFSPYTEQDLESAVAFMLNVAHEFVDDRLFQQAEARKWENRWPRIKEDIGKKVFQIKYDTSEWIDRLKEKVGKKLKPIYKK